MYGQAKHIHSAADAVIDLSTMIHSGAGSVKKNSCLFWFFNKDDFVTSIKTAFEELWNWLINKISFGDKKNYRVSRENVTFQVAQLYMSAY